MDRPDVDITRGFNPNLHGARGLFALMIVVYHVINSGLPTFGFLLTPLALFGARSLEHAVELFFGISGIVIVGALARARGPVVFAVERATRIYPVLWASVAVILGATALTHFEGRAPPSGLAIAANLLALPPVVPGPLVHPAAWSLSYEMLFYGFCAVAWALRRRLGRWSLVLVVVAAALLLATHVRALLMVVGMGVAWTLMSRPGLSRFAPAPGVALVLFLSAWELLCVRNSGDLMHAQLAQLIQAPSLALVALAAVAASFSFAGILAGNGLFSILLRSGPFQWLGTISYSLYLWHPLVMSVLKHWIYLADLPHRMGPYSQLVFLGLALAPSLGVAWASQAVLERRATRWLRARLEPGKRAKPPTTTVACSSEELVNAPGR